MSFGEAFVLVILGSTATYTAVWAAVGLARRRRQRRDFYASIATTVAELRMPSGQGDQPPRYAHARVGGPRKSVTGAGWQPPERPAPVTYQRAEQ
jgi:hypothetical protein